MHFSEKEKKKKGSSPSGSFSRQQRILVPVITHSLAQVMGKVVHAQCGDREDYMSVLYEELGALCVGKGNSG